MNVDFYPAGRGIGHQIMIEEGYAFPGTMAVASDSHSNMYGGIGCLGTPIVRTDASAIWATSETWWQIPPIVKVELTGKLPFGLTGKDVIVALCGRFNQNEVLNSAIEFHGDGIESLSIDDRLTVSNMTTEWGALAGVFPTDDKTISWLEMRSKFLSKKIKNSKEYDLVPSSRKRDSHPRINDETISFLRQNILKPDEGAIYSKHLKLDLSSLYDSFVSGPNSVQISTPVSVLESQRIAIQKAYLVSCTNSRASDIKSAAQVVKKLGERVHPQVELYVAAASSEVQSESELSGDWQTLLNAGAKPLPPGCGPCIGLGAGLLDPGETGISSTNRNFKGRMGSREADVYLASPAVVMSSSIFGYICGAESNENINRAQYRDINTSLIDLSPRASSDDDLEPETAQIELSNKKIDETEIILCPGNNINTDAIYPGKYTYREDLSNEEMAKVSMENYFAGFHEIVGKKDTLVVGANFGTGSSREQAATCLKNLGIKTIIGNSFSETYKRNSLNNGVICIECKPLVDLLVESSGVDFSENKCVKLPKENKLRVDLEEGIVEYISDKSKIFMVSKLGEMARKLIECGGLEQWVRSSLSAAKA